MAIWEYKVISSGKGGFATPVMLEKFLNDLGKEEWEIIDFTTPADNPLAFNGLARRPTQRDWTLADATAAAAKEEADKLREEFEAKFKGLAPVGGAEDDDSEVLENGDDYRRPMDTSRDQDPDADDDEAAPKDEWEQLMEGDDLPTFFEAMRPHMRRNQRGAGISVGVSYLANKWNFDDADIIGALEECGFVLPEDEDTKPAYLDYDGDLFWVNINRRGELWINTKEKPMPVFRTVGGEPIELEEEPKKKGKKSPEKPKADSKSDKLEKPEKSGKSKEEDLSGKPLPKGEELLTLIRPKMRRSRRDPGHSGSMTFLSRALKCSAEDLQAAFVELGLSLSENKDEKTEPTVIGDELWWLNQDSRGGVWINGRENKADAESAPQSKGDAKLSLLSSARPHLTTVRKGTFSQETGAVAKKLEQLADDFLNTLVAAGLKVPEKPRQKPVIVDHGGASYWLTRNTKDQILLNAKAAEKSEAVDNASEKPVDSPPAKEEPASDSKEKKTRRPRSRKSASAKK